MADVFVPDYADAVTLMAERHNDQLRDFGGFLAQAGVPIEPADLKNPLVAEGYARQLRDYPEG